MQILLKDISSAVTTRRVTLPSLESALHGPGLLTSARLSAVVLDGLGSAEVKIPRVSSLFAHQDIYLNQLGSRAVSCFLTSNAYTSDC